MQIAAPVLYYLQLGKSKYENRECGTAEAQHQTSCHYISFLNRCQWPLLPLIISIKKHPSRVL